MVKNYLLLRKKVFTAFLLISIITLSVNIFLPYISGKYLDNLIKIRNVKVVYIFTGLLICVFLTDIVLSYLKGLAYTKLANLCAFDLNYHVFEHVKRLPITYFKGINSAYLTQRINSDSNLVTGFVIENSVALTGNILTFIVAAAYMAGVNELLSFLSLLIIPIYAVLYISFRKVLFQKGYESREMLNLFFGKMNEQLYKIKLIKINSWYEVFAVQLKEAFKPVYKSQMEMTKTQGFYSAATKIVTHASKILVFFIGGMQVINEKMSFGEFTAINVYFTMLLDCTAYFISLGQSYQQALVSHKRLREILDTPAESNGNLIIGAIDSIEFKNVIFGYDRRRPLLEGFNQIFQKGNIYCIIGSNGTGKSTLIDLMVGLLSDYSGDIFIDRLNLKEVNLYNLRRNLIGYVEQEPVLFSDSVLNNLTFGIEKRGHDEINKIVNVMRITELLKALPNGLDSQISEKANNISGGEKQKISIARTLLKDAELLVFDEPTSAMDSLSIENFKELLSGIKNEKIIVVITHSNDLLDIADNIINLGENSVMTITA
jgi:ATP-binding cassette subfamily C protein